MMKALLVVCHPDDESLWVGATLAATSLAWDLTWHVVSLSGLDSASSRGDEFTDAMVAASWGTGRVLGGPLRAASDPLPPMATTLDEGLTQDGLAARDFAIVISHSPFGDEHRNPHHKQAHREVRKWARAHRLPFGFFSPTLIPAGTIRPNLRSLHRHGPLHATLAGRCRFGPFSKLRYFTWTGSTQTPKYVVQLIGDAALKTIMLQSYRSIDQSAHRETYAAFTNALETVYLSDAVGYDLLLRRIEQLPVPGPDPLFRSLRDFVGIALRRVVGE